MNDGYTKGRSFLNFKEVERESTYPPVGYYNIAEKIGQNKIRWSFYPRGKVFNDKNEKFLPAPN